MTGRIRKYIVSAVFVLLPVLFLHAQQKRGKSRGIFKADFSIQTAYDDNVLKYSVKYLDRFMNRQDEGRFEMQTYDDLSVKMRLGMYYKAKWAGKRYTRIGGSYLRMQYAVNGFKSWDLYTLYLRQDLSRKTSLQATYQYLPYFYVRTYRDEDLVDIYGYEPRTFRPFEFSKEHYGLTFRTKFSKPGLSLRWDMGIHRYFHNEHFTEYDAGKYYSGVRLWFSASRKFKINTAYQYAYNDAEGTDEPGEDKRNSDDPDATFSENKFSIKVTYNLPKWFHKRQSIDLGGVYTLRGFNTEKNYRDDPTHAGRLDHIGAVSVQYSVRWNKRVKSGLFVHYNYRNSTNDGSEYYRELLADEKNYNQTLYGISFSYQIF